MALEHETDVYRARFAELLDNEGKYVVVKGDDLIGPFDDYEGALEGCYGKYGPVSFLVKKVERVEPVYYFTRDLPPMPILTGKIEAWGGPFLDVAVMQTPQYVESLKRSGRPFSEPRVACALIDTGAGTSAIDRGMAAALALEPRGEVQIHTPSTGTAWETRETYDLWLVLGPGERSLLARAVQVVESDFAAHGFLLIVGRDVLKECTFIYNGSSARYSLKWVGKR